MRKLAVIIAAAALAFAALALADSECFVHDYDCADEGDKCIGDFIYNGTEVCGNESRCCAYPLFCINGTCAEDSRDMECQTKEDCHSAVFGTNIIACIKNKCVVQGSFNDSCTKNDHCAGDQICEKGVCSGLNISAKCDESLGLYNYQCGANLTCLSGKCQVPKALGEKCDSDTECDIYSLCNKGVCTERYTVKSNESCDRLNACEKGLYCDNTVGKCMPTVPSQYIECTKDEDCASYGNTSKCSECNAVTGKMFCSDPENVEMDCVAEVAAAWKCYRKNGCAPTPSSSLDTCTQLECTAETNAIFTCRSMCEDKKRVAGAKCLAGVLLRYCPLLPTWLRIVIAFSFLIVIIIVVFIFYGIYRCCKKNDDYSQLASDSETTQG